MGPVEDEWLCNSLPFCVPCLWSIQQSAFKHTLKKAVGCINSNLGHRPGSTGHLQPVLSKGAPRLQGGPPDMVTWCSGAGTCPTLALQNGVLHVAWPHMRCTCEVTPHGGLNIVDQNGVLRTVRGSQNWALWGGPHRINTATNWMEPVLCYPKQPRSDLYSKVVYS